jgi:outer membrane protein assembly factor BamE (lipoprotein component of BamABCDE complex)
MFQQATGNTLKILSSMPRYLPAAILAACLLAACTPKVEKTGYVFTEEDLGAITPGISDRAAVMSKLGSPSTRSTFGPEHWYYIHNRKEAYGFLRHEITEQDVLSIAFDEAGIVQEVKKYDLSDSEDVAIVQRETPSEGHSLSFFEQVLGNIGRFNSPASNQPGNSRNGPQR